jgi:Xaa-Pro aminopeptidase
MTANQPKLLAKHCLARQQRVRETLERLSVDRAIFVSHENIEYLTGFRPHRLMQAAVCLERDGDCLLAAPNSEPEDVQANAIVTFEAQWCATLRQEQAAASVAALADTIKILPANRTAVEFSVCGSHVRALIAGDASELIDLDAEIWRLRRRKDPDELAMIAHAIRCTEAMYKRAREIVEPGITELQVFGQLHAAAVETAGEQLTALGNDYQCNSPGGPPRSRAAQDGELYILDLGPAYRGYYADNCRTIAVNCRPTDEQHRAWEKIVSVLSMVEETVRPGVSCRELFLTAKSMLDEYCPGAFPHHLGHGFGLYPHEAPHLNPNWDDKFEVGDVFTAEPGLYTDELAAGVRIEQNYRVTKDGVQRLTDFSLEL